MTMPAQNSNPPVRQRWDQMSEKKKELNEIADEKFFEYWFCRDRKQNKRLFDEYLALVREANAISE